MTEGVNLCESCLSNVAPPSPFPFGDRPWWEMVCLENLRHWTSSAEVFKCSKYRPVLYSTRFERILKGTHSV
jgi:hypothetical protein